MMLHRVGASMSGDMYLVRHGQTMFNERGLPSLGAGKALELGHGQQEGTEEQVRQKLAPLGAQVQGAAEAVPRRRGGALGGLPDGPQPRHGQPPPRHVEGAHSRDLRGRQPLRRRGRGRREPLRRGARAGRPGPRGAGRGDRLRPAQARCCSLFQAIGSGRTAPC